MTNQTPAEWLIEQYEDTAIHDTRPEDWARVVIQPLYRLKSLTDTGHPMHIIPADYRDHGRWWL